MIFWFVSEVRLVYPCDIKFRSLIGSSLDINHFFDLDIYDKHMNLDIVSIWDAHYEFNCQSRSGSPMDINFRFVPDIQLTYEARCPSKIHNMTSDVGAGLDLHWTSIRYLHFGHIFLQVPSDHYVCFFSCFISPVQNWNINLKYIPVNF